jgi:hypothetical protein
MQSIFCWLIVFSKWHRDRTFRRKLQVNLKQIVCFYAVCGEPAISHDSHHVSLVQWTNTFAFRHKGHRFKSPGGVLMWNRDSPVSVVSLHWWPRRDWSSTGLRPQQLSLGPRANNVTVPLDLTHLSCPSFTLAAGLPSGFTTDSCWGGALWRACNLTWFSPCLTGPVD